MAVCGEIELLLGPFEDGELRPREMEDVAFHVVGCDACRAALEGYRSLGVALRGVTAAPRLDGFTQAVMKRIAGERPPLISRIREYWESLGRFGSVIQVAGFATASAVLTFVLLAPRVSESFHPPSTAQLVLATQNRALPQPDREQLAPKQPTQEPVVRKQAGPSTTAPLMVANATVPDPSGASDEAAAIAARDSEELVSELGGGNGPSVAVWDEPRSGTTVVWVPDQQP
jgi:anti-sigma factor RsiW